MSQTEARASTGSPSAISTGSGPADNGPDWADQVTGLVVDSVDKIRDRTTGPILEYSRASVHLVVALILMLPLAVLLCVGFVRLLTWAVVGRVWLSYTILGSLFVLIGVVLWSKRSKLPV